MRGRRFRADRGGTFTDVAARRPDALPPVRKPLSDNRAGHPDAAACGGRAPLHRAEAARASRTVSPAGAAGPRVEPADRTSLEPGGSGLPQACPGDVLAIETPGGGRLRPTVARTPSRRRKDR